MWGTLGRRLRKCQRRPRNVRELADALREEWARIPRYLLGRFNEAETGCSDC